MIRPYGDKILVEKLDGHGIETTSAGGIVLPAVKWQRGKTKHVADTFRARVIRSGPEASKTVAEGDEVVVYTYSREGHGQALTGWETPYGLIISLDDVLVVLEPSDHIPVTPFELIDREVSVADLLRPLGYLVAQ